MTQKGVLQNKILAVGCYDNMTGDLNVLTVFLAHPVLLCNTENAHVFVISLP